MLFIRKKNLSMFFIYKIHPIADLLEVKMRLGESAAESSKKTSTKVEKKKIIGEKRLVKDIRNVAVNLILQDIFIIQAIFPRILSVHYAAFHILYCSGRCNQVGITCGPNCSD